MIFKKDKSKLVVISNRLPITVSIKDGALSYKPSAGGLISGVEASLKKEHLWVGWPGISKDELTDAQVKSVTEYLKERNCIPVFLDRRDVENYYEGFCNRILWPVFHDNPPFERSQKNSEIYWQQYKKVNDKFAEIVKKNVKSGGRVWVHDYHLMLLPRLLKASNNNLKVGFFLHTPFPHPEHIINNPWARDILDSLRDANLIGLQTPRDCENFNSISIHRGPRIDKGGITTLLATPFPIGVNYKKYYKARNTKEVKERVKILEKEYCNATVILSVDRLDPVKNISERVDAYERLLINFPFYAGSIVYRIIAVPTRSNIEEYKKERDVLEMRVREVNEKYSNGNWMPIVYSYGEVNFTELIAHYCIAKIALITPRRDGMNLVAKEFVAVNEGLPKALVLSEGVGASVQLKEGAFIVHNNAPEEIADKLADALRANKKQLKSRMDAMTASTKSQTARLWGKDILRGLE